MNKKMNMNMDMSHIVIIVLLVVILYFVLRLNYPMKNNEGFVNHHNEICHKCNKDPVFKENNPDICAKC